MYLEGFVSYCETPGIGASGKGTSYRNAIQYLCNYLKIDINTFSKEDLNCIKDHEYEISCSGSNFYKDLLKYLTSQGRKSYLSGGFIRAALPYFYDYCETQNII
jgi:hypothetical protein